MVNELCLKMKQINENDIKKYEQKIKELEKKKGVIYQQVKKYYQGALFYANNLKLENESYEMVYKKLGTDIIVLVQEQEKQKIEKEKSYYQGQIMQLLKLKIEITRIKANQNIDGGGLQWT